MEALQGRRDEGEVENDNKMMVGQDPVERWLEELRKDLEEGDREDNRFDGLRSEAMFWRVWERTKTERARGSWISRVRRSLRSLASFGA